MNDLQICTNSDGFLQDKAQYTNNNKAAESVSTTTEQKSPLTTHILDTTIGIPAASVQVELYEVMKSSQQQALETRTTDTDGRVGFLFNGTLKNDTVYKLRFDIEPYFARMNRSTFYPFIEIVFRIQNPAQHYHVPLLLSNYGYTTYRGS